MTGKLSLAALSIVASSLVVLSCATPDPRLPPVTRRATTEHHPGKVIWLDLTTPDVSVAEQFYGPLFGWTFYADPDDAGYVTVYLRDHLIGGIVTPHLGADGGHQSGWLTYLAVRDVDAVARTAVRGGGKVLAAPRMYRGRGRQAVLTDSQGAVFAVMASATGDPPDTLIEPDRWIWSTVLAHDVRAASEFYKATIGYTIDPLPPDQGLAQVVLESGGYARATLNEISHDKSAPHPRWINFIRVEDALDTVNKAMAHGAHVLVSPHSDRHGGRIALLADPQGAWFGVMEWPDGDHPRAAK